MEIILIWTHFLADFLMQSDKMAINKSSSNIWLGIHTILYSLPFFIFGCEFAIINGLAHFIVDWFTSRGTSLLHQKGQRHWFFCLIGLDQIIHITILILTWDIIK